MYRLSQTGLKELIKESVREALEEELPKVRLALFPDISDKEQTDISTRYKKPSRRAHRRETIKL